MHSSNFSFSSKKFVSSRTVITSGWFCLIRYSYFLVKFSVTTAVLTSPARNSFSMSGWRLTKHSIYTQNSATYNVAFTSKDLFMCLPLFASSKVARPYISDSVKASSRPLLLIYFPSGLSITWSLPNIKQEVVTYLLLWL